MAFIELRYMDGDGTRRIVREELGDTPVFTDRADPTKAFQLVRAVHGGGNGVVLAATRLDKRGSPNAPVAVKILRQLDPGPRDRFANEERILFELTHPSITRLYGSGSYRAVSVSAEVPWVAMDLCGANLRQHVRHRGPLGPELLRHVGMQVCEALHYVHECDIIHRDLKPANIVWADKEQQDALVARCVLERRR